MPHLTDDIGYPIDPELRRLEFHLGDLAARWRGYRSAEDQATIVQEYHKTMEQLYILGWDSTLDIDSELPQRLMPLEYLKRNPRVGGWKLNG